MMGTGSFIFNASLAAEVPSGGTSTPGVAAGGLIFIAGAISSVHGTMTFSNAKSNFSSLKGRVSEENKKTKKGKVSTKNEKKINSKRKDSWSNK